MKVVNIFRVTSHNHIFWPYRQTTVKKVEIVAVSFRFLAHIEWPRGNVYLFIYLQMCDQYYNTDFVHVCPRRVNRNLGVMDGWCEEGHSYICSWMSIPEIVKIFRYTISGEGQDCQDIETWNLSGNPAPFLILLCNNGARIF